MHALDMSEMQPTERFAACYSLLRILDRPQCVPRSLVSLTDQATCGTRCQRLP